jgi:lipid II:glycine glycyltransferase (peptidoglycan interpeptide bridge formation enzyme)
MQWAKEAGCAVYDFGAWSKTAEPGTGTEGVRLFKAGFSKTVVEYVGPHRKVLRPVEYRLWEGLSRMRGG